MINKKMRFIACLLLISLVTAMLVQQKTDAASKNKKALRAFKELLADESIMQDVFCNAPYDGIENCQHRGVVPRLLEIPDRRRQRVQIIGVLRVCKAVLISQ